MMIENESLFVHAFNNASIGMAFVAPNGQWLKVNGSFCKIVGYSEEELLTMQLKTLTYRNSLDLSNLVQRALEGTLNHFQLEKGYIHKEGHIVWVVLNTSVVRDEKGKLLYFIDQIQDITEHHKTRRKLYENEEHYKSLFQYNPDGVAQLNTLGNFVSVNPALEKLVGYSQYEFLKSNLMDLNITEAQKYFYRTLSGEPLNYEAAMRHKLGYEIYVHVTNVPIIIDKEVVGIYCIVKDISESKRTTEQLRDQEKLFELISENAQDIIVYLSPKLTYEYVSPGLKSMLGYESEEFVGRTLFDFLHPDDFETITKTDILKNSDAETMTFRIRHKNGHYVWVENTVKVVRNEQGAIEKILAIARDISERIKAEEEKKRAQQLMLNSEKLSIVGQLAAGIAHEIRNPLTAVKGFLKLMERQWNDKPYYFHVLTSEIDRMELIVNELLILSKPQAHEYYQTNLRVILEQVITLLEPQAHLKNVEVTAKYYTDDQLCILCDENQIKQIFINFIKNGIESMENGGEILVNVSREGNGHRDGIWTTIIDQGCGISEEQLKKLGEPFYSTKERGTGLGFMVSQKIIESHNGTIKVTSKINEGTTVAIFLPQYENDRSYN